MNIVTKSRYKMKIKVYIEDVHKYTVKSKKLKDGNTRWTMKRSKDSMWTNPGELLYKVIDDGNILRFLTTTVTSRYVDYCKAQELMILLSVMEGDDIENIVYKTK
jgi:hypothetical protein